MHNSSINFNIFPAFLFHIYRREKRFSGFVLCKSTNRVDLRLLLLRLSQKFILLFALVIIWSGHTWFILYECNCRYSFLKRQNIKFSLLIMVVFYNSLWMDVIIFESSMRKRMGVNGESIVINVAFDVY